MAKKHRRIVEAYCLRDPIKRKNPLGFEKKMVAAGGCIISVGEFGKPVKYFGADTIKIIPVSKSFLKGLKSSRKKK